MKLTFFSKVIRTIGLMGAIATLAATGIQPIAQAQEINVPADIDDDACIAAGFNTFYRLQNIDLSYEQIEQIFELQRQQAVASEALINSYPTEDDLGGSYAFISRPGATITPEVSAAMDAAALKLTSGEALIGEIAALNEQFGQYGEFGLGKNVLLTPERRAEMRQLNTDFDARYISVLTPQQQQQYQENLATESKIDEACGIVTYDNSNYNFSRSFEPSFF